MFNKMQKTTIQKIKYYEIEKNIKSDGNYRYDF